MNRTKGFPPGRVIKMLGLLVAAFLLEHPFVLVDRIFRPLSFLPAKQVGNN